MSVEDSIMMQTAAKVAAELAASVGSRSSQEAIDSFNACFDAVYDSMKQKLQGPRTTTGGRAVKIISSDDIKSSIANVHMNSNSQAGTKVTSNFLNG